jgi:hypothetical protein
MLWVWLSAIIVLAGAELNSEIEKRKLFLGEADLSRAASPRAGPEPVPVTPQTLPTAGRGVRPETSTSYPKPKGDTP